MAVRLFPLDAMVLLAVGAWAFSGGRLPAFDPRESFPFVAALVTSVSALGAYHGAGGAAHVAGLGVAVGLVGLGFRDAGRRVTFAGLATVLLLAPFGFPFYQAATILAGLALVEAAVLGRRLATVVAVQVALAVGAYGFLLLLEYSKGRYSLVPTEEAALLGLLAAASVIGALVVDRREASVAAGVAVWGLATRFALLTLGLPDGGAITVAWTAVCAGLFAVGFLRKRPELRQLGLAVAARDGGEGRPFRPRGAGRGAEGGGVAGARGGVAGRRLCLRSGEG